MAFRRKHKRPEISDAALDEVTDDVMATTKLIYRFYKQAPELSRFDEKRLWQVMYDSLDENGKGVLADLKDTFIWSQAVPAARAMYEMYAAGGIEESPGH